MVRYLYKNILIYGSDPSLFEQIIGTAAIAGFILLWCWQVSA